MSRHRQTLTAAHERIPLTDPTGAAGLKSPHSPAAIVTDSRPVPLSESDFKILLGQLAERCEHALAARLPGTGQLPTRLHAAMRYAVLGGGKRVRPFLVYAAGMAIGSELDILDAPACAVEIIHAYSLVHDDLPAMDDDDLRRGRPTLHKAFDEGMAILTGDALNTIAFHIIAQDPTTIGDPGRRLRMVAVLAEAAGAQGMAGGQAMDLAAAGNALTLTELQAMHTRKTGALLRASILLGAITAQASAEQEQALDRYSHCMGLAFQIQDDILDVVGDTRQLGKTAGADAALHKPTYPGTIGLEASREQAKLLHQQAIGALAPFGDSADALRAMAAYIINREH